MSDNRQRAEKLEQRRNIPALAEKKEITPESPCGGLRGDEQCVIGVKMKRATKQRRDRGICRKKSDIGNFHHFVIDRRHGRGIAAIHDVHEPITVVLNERGISVGKWPFRREKKHGHCELC